MSTATATKLSRLQERILAALLCLCRQVEERGNDFAKTDLAVWGVPLQWLRGKRQVGVSDYTPADSAAFSRALVRLEQRDFILRSNQMSGVPSGPGAGRARTSKEQPHGRTTHVRLLDAGRKMAETVKT